MRKFSFSGSAINYQNTIIPKQVMTAKTIHSFKEAHTQKKNKGSIITYDFN